MLIRIAKKCHKWSTDHPDLIHGVFLGMSVIILASVTVYSSYYASTYQSTNSDAIVAAYLFGDGFKLHQVVLPVIHSGILKIPLFYIQGHLPYHFTSFVLVNMGLVLLTVAAWAFLLIKLFGRKYELPIVILLATLMLTAIAFNINIAYATVRNIEYPIALWFIFIINRALKKGRQSHKELAATIVGSILFSAVLAGDSLFYYAIILPILLVIIWYWVQSNKLTTETLKSGGIVALTILGASTIKIIVIFSGLSIFNNLGTSNHTTKILNFNAFFPSAGIALDQLLKVQGANIFGISINSHNLFLFLNLAILVIGVIGLLLIIIKSSIKYRVQKTIENSNDFILTVLAMSFFMTFIIYIFSGQVATVNNGVVTDLHQLRYLTIMPLISIVGFIWVLKTYYSTHKPLIYISFFLILISSFFALKPINSQYSAYVQNSEHFRASLIDISTILEQNHVKEALTGYWYGATLRFWSHNEINYVPKVGCNTPFNLNARDDWFTANNIAPTALVIDHSGPDAPFWVCSNKQLIDIYGQPSKIQTASGINPNTYVYLWIYNYDVRQKLLPILHQ